MLYNLHFFSSKCRLFHNAILFGFCITHILNTGCAKIWKKKSVAKRLRSYTSRKHVSFVFSPTWPIWKQQIHTFCRCIIQNLVWVLNILIVIFEVFLTVDGLVGLEDRVSIPGKNRNYFPRYHLQSIRGANSAPTSSGRGGSSVRASGLSSPRNIAKNRNKCVIRVFYGTPKIFL